MSDGLPTDDQIIAAYPVFDVPSDTLVMDTGKLADFAESIDTAFRRMNLDWLARRLVNLRKAGRLPKLRDGHGPGVGWKEEKRATV